MDTKSCTITIHRHTGPLPRVTGAAARSVEAADQAAEAAYAQLAAAAKVLQDALNVPFAEANATTIVTALEAYQAFLAATDAVAGLAKRHARYSTSCYFGWPLSTVGLTGPMGAIESAMNTLHANLEDAGVPMGRIVVDEDGTDVAAAIRFWRDAAARGC